MTQMSTDKIKPDLRNDIEAPRAEGRILDFQGHEAIRSDLLMTFDFDSPDQLISVTTKEFSCVCPYSGLPDFGELKVEYYPRGGKAVEFKALKYYLVSFRNVGIYQEEATKRIRQDLEQI